MKTKHEKLMQKLETEMTEKSSLSDNLYGLKMLLDNYISNIDKAVHLNEARKLHKLALENVTDVINLLKSS
jgi:hypothetical protein